MAEVLAFELFSSYVDGFDSSCWLSRDKHNAPWDFEFVDREGVLGGPDRKGWKCLIDVKGCRASRGPRSQTEEPFFIGAKQLQVAEDAHAHPQDKVLCIIVRIEGLNGDQDLRIDVLMDPVWQLKQGRLMEVVGGGKRVLKNTSKLAVARLPPSS
ncbi:hypothetical protein MNEG_10093 [Monoraphidium neglectum]|uniref:Uncharacterized protein n=1 Tax=Monoraphidium neglectum TaxID=145388 RepID=A0A0D2M2J7_9CHLO|nr:hypothetical protein MNEG_10093 [Monoraphidium neglectum]KIY97869.1 hypothetical protein MNEG_10093 [Monoraphidium neglectum]|eukprot:XP_013896889.1 hypothetical protein MNEG_10093 [Monoraphidium neglectum]